ncbi:MAG: hypothetical protein GY869_07285 [Planctomycetes bacterium]|nr:hypothetical protein [Planctomycetota bacterium]
MKTIVWGMVVMGCIFWGGCTKPPEGETQGEVFVYDPTQDPLVNPASLTELPPEDMSLIDTDDSITILLDANPNTLHPFYVSTMSEFKVINAVYTGLFTYNKDIRWQINDDMVQSVQESVDHRETVVTLKEGLTWQDGMPLTAHDVVYSWRRILNEKVPCYSQKPSTEPITGCVALDDTTVKFVQAEPLATARWNLLFPVIPQHLFEKDQTANPDLKSGDYYRRLSRQPVGNGPYRLTEWQDQDRIVLERWSEYPGIKPYFKRIVFRIVPDKNMALLLFEKGELDVIEGLSPQQFARDVNEKSLDGKGVKGRHIGGSYSYIGWNMDGGNPYFSDHSVRCAMTRALNIPLILEKGFYNLATPSIGIYHPDDWTYNPQVKQLAYDPKHAAALLDQAGWFEDQNDGWRTKIIDGKKQFFEFALLIPQNAPGGEQIGAIFQEELKRLGVRLNIHALEQTVYLEKLNMTALNLLKNFIEVSR